MGPAHPVIARGGWAPSLRASTQLVAATSVTRGLRDDQSGTRRTCRDHELPTSPGDLTVMDALSPNPKIITQAASAC